MPIKLAINGFGRIGRSALKIALEKSDVKIVAINDLTDTPTLAHLLKYDTAYGTYQKEVKAEDGKLFVDGQEIKVFGDKEPEKLPWKDLDIDVVLECTGKFTSRDEAGKHLTAGAKAVIISAPSKGDNPAPTYVLGVNGDKISGSDKIINNASCTTNCIAPVMAILQEKFGIKKATMTTIHAYTQDQNIQDGPHKDLRRARAAAANIVPTTTGAAIAATEALPAIKGKFDGIAIRVPVITGSVSDITALLEKTTTPEEINSAFKEASASPRYKGILSVNEDPIVSSDIIGHSASSIVDLPLTQVVGGDLVKVFAWYDNEWGYSNRLVEMAIELDKHLGSSPEIKPNITAEDKLDDDLGL